MGTGPSSPRQSAQRHWQVSALCSGDDRSAANTASICSAAAMSIIAWLLGMLLPDWACTSFTKAARVLQASVRSPEDRKVWTWLTLLARLVPGPMPWTAPCKSASWAAAPSAVTVKLVVAGLLESSESLTEHETVVGVDVVMGNVDPDAGVHVAVGTVVSSGSVTVGRE